MTIARRRVNVASGRSLETVAHYSRAVRCGDTVLLAGTTAIDRQGAVRGVGDVVQQVDTIMRIAEWALGKAGSSLRDVVRSRIYVTDAALADQAARAVATRFRDARPAATLVAVSGLARPEQLVEIELDLVDGAHSKGRRVSSGRPIEEQYAYSRALRVGDRVFISGSTSLNAQGVVEGPGDMYAQTRSAMDTIFRALAEAGGVPGDLVYTKTFVTDLTKLREYARAWLEALGDVRPVSTLLGIPALVLPGMLVEIEAEAIIGASKSRRDVYTEHMREKPRGYARAVEVGDVVYVSGCTSIAPTNEILAVGDWAGQLDIAHEGIRWALDQVGAALDDVIRRRTFNVDGAHINRAHGDGPAWFAASHPASLGCRVTGLARPELLVEVEVSAVKGAHAGIEWIPPDPVDPIG
jgi:enamine deaminase RidA (YjgF/YER057c/UK114 family)